MGLFNLKPFKIMINSYLLKKEPISLIHFITNKCNARCKHCFIDFKNPGIFKNELSLEEIEKLSKTFGKSLFNINLTGGEPFLREDIFEIARLYFKNAKVNSIFITTNGMFTEKIRAFIDKFISSGINGKIIFSISIDNFEKEHDLNRGVPGLFKNSFNSYNLIEGYKNPNITANIGLTVTSHNYNNVSKLYDSLKGKGIKSFTATIMREEGVVKRIDPKIKKNILNSYSKLIKKIREDQLDNGERGFGRGFQFRLMNSKNILMNKIIQKTYLNKKFISPCAAGSLLGVIYANGDIYPCEILSDFKLGNLRDYDMNFIKLWNDKKAKDCRAFIKRTKCSCTFECAWTLNIISQFKFLSPLLVNTLRS